MYLHEKKQPPSNNEQFINNCFESHVFNKIYYIKPVNSICKLNIFWFFPPQRAHYKNKSEGYISALLSDKGVGSLHSYLTNKKWIEETICQTNSSNLYCLICYNVSLTDEGFKHRNEVIESIYAYISLMKKGPQERIYKEIKAMKDQAHKLNKFNLGMYGVHDIASELQYYPPEDILRIYLYLNYNPDEIQALQNLLVPDNMIVVIENAKLPSEIQYDQKEFWYETPYTSIEIPTETLNKWKNMKPFPEMGFPPLNPFVSSDYSILPENSANPKYPRKIYHTPLAEIWYKQDQTYKLPKAHYLFHLYFEKVESSIKSTCLLELTKKILNHSLSEQMDLAEAANLNLRLVEFDFGLYLKFDGYNEKLPILIDIVVKKIQHLIRHPSRDDFNSKMIETIKIKPTISTQLLAWDLSSPMLTTNSYSYTSTDIYNQYLELTYDDYTDFLGKLLTSAYLKVLVQGNVRKETVKDVVSNFVAILGYRPSELQMRPKSQTYKLPEGEHCVRVKTFQVDNMNTVVRNYYQVGEFSFIKNGILEIISELLHEPVFTVLRTTEQLGYSVYMRTISNNDIIGYVIQVTTPVTKATANYVDNRIEAFIEEAHKILASTTEDRLNQAKVAARKNISDIKFLHSEVEENIEHVVNGTYLFDFDQKAKDALESITVDDLTSLWYESNKFGNKKGFRKLSTQIIGYLPNEQVPDQKEFLSSKTKMFLKYLGSEEERVEEMKKGDYFIHDIHRFRRSLSFYDLVDLTNIYNITDGNCSEGKTNVLMPNII